MEKPNRPECKYGAECHRKNKGHFLQYSHPSKPEEESPGNVKPTMVIERGSNSGSANGKSVMVILVGLPASGKSTFCQKVLEGARRPWTRICQDIISTGKRGSKAQCLKCTSEALNKGESVIIDRCNLNKEQWAEFIELAGSQTEVHAVVLDLPTKLCISRAVKRSEHEGGLQGGRAAIAINQMVQTKKPPTLSEGFSRIMFCQTESDVEKAISMYKELGPDDVLPSGMYGDKPEGGMLRYFKKERDSQNCKSSSKSIELLNSHHTSQRNSEKFDTQDMKQVIPCNKTSDRKTTESNAVHSYGCSVSGTSSNDCVQTLAFPSISTSDFHFDHEKAANIIIEKVSEFLEMHKTSDFRLIMVDLVHDSDMLSRVRVKAAEKRLDSKRFLTFVGDITKLYSKGGLKCNIIVNAANWRLKAGGGGVNAAIFKAAGPEFEVVTKEHAKTLSTGTALVVPLPRSSPLYEKEGVTHVIHVVGPNMNPQRPNCLAGDYVKGCKVLRDTYSSLFGSFASIFKTREQMVPNPEIRESLYSENKVEVGNSNQIKETKDSATKNAFAVLMQASRKNNVYESDKKTKRQDLAGPEISKKCKTDTVEHLPTNIELKLRDETAGPNLDPTGDCLLGYKNNAQSTTTIKRQTVNRIDGKNGKGTTWEAWAQALHEIALKPERHEKTVLECSDSVVVLPDLYPKAKKHVLVVARLDGLDSLADVRKEHIPLLRHIHSVGEKWATSFLQEDPSMIFRLGYHSVPSMRQLHLHVISLDFDSQHMKNKKHWNSFTTKFFRDSVEVLEEVEKVGKVEIKDDKDILSMELRCHRCRSAHPNIPRLKSHIANCKAPFPSSLSWGRHLMTSPSRERLLETI